jgi:hypothetical protein
MRLPEQWPNTRGEIGRIALRKAVCHATKLPQP